MDIEVIQFANKQGYTEKDLSDRRCLKCGKLLFKEKFKTPDKYPFYCAYCDENMFGFEVDYK